MKKYLSCAETAKLVRTALKESFPNVKFSVRSSVYSGGASINVSYVNGPTYDQVKAVVAMFEGSYFCGMTDYKGNNYSSMDGQEISFGADYIFVNRSFTVAFLEKAVEDAAIALGFDKPKVVDSPFGAKYSCDDFDVERLICDKVSKVSGCESNDSPTLNRIKFLGDDGYGYNSVGRLNA